MIKANCTTWPAAVLLSLVAAGQAHAQSAGGNDAEIAVLKQQLRLMEQKLDKLQRQTAANTTAAATANAKADAKINVANANAAAPAKAPVAPPSAIVKMPGNRPTICTADNLNCVAITSRLHLDVGGYDYRPNSASTIPAHPQNGVNARRARIGVLGTFAGDWDYGLVYDFGGSQDNLTPAINYAYVTYKGIKGLYIEGGYIEVPYTQDESLGSNNIMFMERASPQVVAANIAAGDNRSAFGARANGDSWWVGSYVTGPASRADHTLRPQVGATARGVVLPVNNQYGSFLLGADAEFLFDTGGAPNTHNLTLSDFPEVRIDPSTNQLLNAALANVRGARVFGGEAAGEIGSFYAQGEYFDYRIDRLGGLPDLHFNGGYVQASYMITGESRKYNPVLGAYGTINPKNPVQWSTGGWGAWEIAARYSQTKLNDLNVLGGELRDTTLGVNWYVNENMRFMFNWVHGSVARNTAAPANTDIGAHYDVFALRTQVAF
jgi:phosphate-selective porin OprO/OprP